MSTELQAKDPDNLPITDPGLADAARAEKSLKPTLTGDITGATNVAPKTDPKAPAPLVDGSKKTWGEKVYNNVVYQVFGFGVNLGFSSFLTYLTLHSKWPVPKFMQTTYTTVGKDAVERKVESISDVYHYVRNGFAKNPITQSFGKGSRIPLNQDNPAREDRAKVMSGALVLTLGGHIMIPIIKMFEDRKTSIIKQLDEWHYGKDAEQAPEISMAHQRIAEEIRPTLLSTTLARIGSVAAVQLSSRTFGATNNLIKATANKMNLPLGKGFHGIDNKTEGWGEFTAGMLGKGVSKHIDNFLHVSGNTQRGSNITIFTPKGKVEGVKSPTALLFKYGFSDVIYTIITAVSIKPMNNWLIRNFSFLRKEPEKAAQEQKPFIRNAGVYADEAAPAAQETEANEQRPTLAISNTRREGIVNAAPEIQKA